MKPGMLPVGLVLVVVVGLIGCGKKPQRMAPKPVVSRPKPMVDEPEPVVDDPKLQQLVWERAQECSTALLEGDYARFVDLNHPKVVEGLGGRDKMIARLQSGVEDMTKGVTICSAKVDAPTEFAMAGPDLIAIIPTVIEMDAPIAGECTYKGFLIGVSSDKGKTWTFIDGSPLDREKIKKLLPDFPDKLKLPKVEEPDYQRLLYARLTQMRMSVFQGSLMVYRLDLGDYPTPHKD